ncbi:MAG: ABC transporter permease [Alphaproteobacteria bacterium]
MSPQRARTAGLLADLAAAMLTAPLFVSTLVDGTGAAATAAALFAPLAVAALALLPRAPTLPLRLLPFACAVVGAAAPLLILDGGSAGPTLWLYMIGYTALLWRSLALLAAEGVPRPISRGLVAAVFGIGLVWYWQVIVAGFGVPRELLPAPSAIAAEFAGQTGVLWSDFVVTFFLSVLPGFAVGSAAGFLFALAVDGRPFLARGLLPLGSAFSAIPIVAVAPIMIMWFGSGPESKAAVVVLMTFFPMMVNTLGGLATVDRMELDLMHSYGAGYWTRLLKLRLPTALPFVFTALKINATLAMIGAIVSEFFGSPLAGMGFRISAMIGRLNLEMVWSTIAVAALAGSLFYGIWAVLERIFTFWHPAQRR